MYRTPKGFNNPKGLSDEKAARMMTALRDGHTLRFFAVKEHRLEAYFAAHPEYAREARPLIDANAKAAKLRKGSRRRSQTHCKYGHPLSGDNLRIFNLRRGVGRGCRACMKRNGETGRKFSEDQARRTVAALQEGQTISDITKSGGAFYIAIHRALLLFRQKQPKFDTLVLRLSAKNADVHRKDAGSSR
jgi:hypothetical protein